VDAAGVLTAPASITVEMLMEGTFSSDHAAQDFQDALGQLAIRNSFKGVDVVAGVKFDGGPAVEVTQFGTAFGGGSIDALSVLSTDTRLLLSAILDLGAGDGAFLDLLADLAVRPNPGTFGTETVDFGHTATLRVILPTGLTGFESESGVFLTQVVATPVATPEPTTLTLMLLGLGGVGVRFARRPRPHSRSQSGSPRFFSQG